MLTIPKAAIRRERKRRGWSLDKLADKMTAARDESVRTECPPYTFQIVARLENGRGMVRFDDDNEPLWWAMVALELPVEGLLGRGPSPASPTAPRIPLGASTRPQTALRPQASR